jgi:hypothetical protein
LVRTSSAIWETFDGTHDRIQAASRQAGGAFGPTQTFSNAVGSTNNARLAVDPQGNALAVWSGEDFEGTKGLQAAFRPVGGTFGPPQTLSAPGQNAGGAQVAFDAQGNAIAIWRRSDVTSDGTKVRIQAAFRPTGGAFGPSQTLSAGNASFEVLAVNAQGNALVAWQGFDGASIRIQAAFRSSGGIFGPPQALSDAGAGQNDVGAPGIVLDAQGNAAAIWTRSDGAKLRIQAAFRPAGGAFSPPQTLSDAGQNAFGEKVVLDLPRPTNPTGGGSFKIRPPGLTIRPCSCVHSSAPRGTRCRATCTRYRRS